MPKFLVDESTGRAVFDFLSRTEKDAVYAGDARKGAADAALLEMARMEGRILVTNDKDFGELVFQQRLPCPGIVLFRLRDEHPTNRVLAMERLLHARGHQLEGWFIVVSDEMIRVRKLPAP